MVSLKKYHLTALDNDSNGGGSFRVTIRGALTLADAPYPELRALPYVTSIVPYWANTMKVYLSPLVDDLEEAFANFAAELNCLVEDKE